MKHLDPLGGPSNSPTCHTRQRFQTCIAMLCLCCCRSFFFFLILSCWEVVVTFLVLLPNTEHLLSIISCTSLCSFHGKWTDLVQASGQKDEVVYNYLLFQGAAFVPSTSQNWHLNVYSRWGGGEVGDRKAETRREWKNKGRKPAGSLLQYISH